MIRVKSVIAHSNFHLTITFENNVTKTLDMNFIFDESGPVVDPLKSFDQFNKVFVDDGIITWPTGYDIDPEYLLEIAS